MNTEEQNTPAPKPSSPIRGVACDKHALVTAIIACPRCINELIAERDAASAEEVRRANTKPEPSRLEIAAMMMAANFSRECDTWNTEFQALWCIEQADALIAAANK